MFCQYEGLAEISIYLYLLHTVYTVYTVIILYILCTWRIAAIQENTYSVHQNYEETCGEFISHFNPTCHKTTEIRLLMSHKF